MVELVQTGFAKAKHPGVEINSPESLIRCNTEALACPDCEQPIGVLYKPVKNAMARWDSSLDPVFKAHLVGSDHTGNCSAGRFSYSVG